MKSKINDLLFEVKSWKNIPVINGKIASQIDTVTGFAVFYFKNVGVEHKAFEIDLSKLEYLINEDDNSKELIVEIQAE